MKQLFVLFVSLFCLTLSYSQEAKYNITQNTLTEGDIVYSCSSYEIKDGCVYFDNIIDNGNILTKTVVCGNYDIESLQYDRNQPTVNESNRNETITKNQEFVPNFNTSLSSVPNIAYDPNFNFGAVAQNIPNIPGIIFPHIHKYHCYDRHPDNVNPPPRRLRNNRSDGVYSEE